MRAAHRFQIAHALWRWLARRRVVDDEASPSPRNAGARSANAEPAALCSAVKAAFIQTETRVRARLDSAISQTEAEVLGCGDALATLVRSVNETIAQTRTDAAAAREQYEAECARFVEGMHAELTAQADAVEHMHALAKRIDDSLAAIRELNQMASILAINARIQAAHFGDRGRTFTVLADRMGELSSTITDSANAVGSTVDDMRHALPPVLERTASMRKHASVFIDAIGVATHRSSAADAATDGDAATEGLSKLMELSNRALSHLQFQDPMVQNIGAIPRELDRLRTNVGRLLDGMALPEDPSLSETASQPEPEAGALVMF